MHAITATQQTDWEAPRQWVTGRIEIISNRLWGLSCNEMKQRQQFNRKMDEITDISVLLTAALTCPYWKLLKACSDPWLTVVKCIPSTFLCPLLFFCIVLLLFKSSLFFPFLLMIHSSNFFPGNSPTFSHMNKSDGMMVDDRAYPSLIEVMLFEEG